MTKEKEKTHEEVVDEVIEFSNELADLVRKHTELSSCDIVGTLEAMKFNIMIGVSIKEITKQTLKNIMEGKPKNDGE